jgi:hypothetical protein
MRQADIGSNLAPAILSRGLAARGKRENSSSGMPFLAVETTGETPVPQFRYALPTDLPRACHSLAMGCESSVMLDLKG